MKLDYFKPPPEPRWGWQEERRRRDAAGVTAAPCPPSLANRMQRLLRAAILRRG